MSCKVQRKWLTTVLLIIQCVNITMQADCPNYPEREVWNKISKTLDFSQCGIKNIKMQNHEFVEIYDAKNNSVTEITKDDFKNATALTSIILSNNRISNIHKEAFVDQKKLRKLFLNNNLLKIIEVGTFDSLLELRILHLNNNNLSILENGIFGKNTNLRRLDLGNNKLTSIEPTLFEPLQNIASIDLSPNPWSERVTLPKIFNNHHKDQSDRLCIGLIISLIFLTTVIAFLIVYIIHLKRSSTTTSKTQDENDIEDPYAITVIEATEPTYINTANYDSSDHSLETSNGLAIYAQVNKASKGIALDR